MAARFVLRLLALLVAIFAALLATVFSVDLGPSLRGRAEREASRYLERPMHIGEPSAKLRPSESAPRLSSSKG